MLLTRNNIPDDFTMMTMNVVWGFLHCWRREVYAENLGKCDKVLDREKWAEASLRKTLGKCRGGGFWWGFLRIMMRISLILICIWGNLGIFFEDCEDYDENWEDDEKKRMTKIRDSGAWGKPSQRRGVRANVRSTLKLGYDDHHDHYDSRSWCLWWWRRLIYIGAVYGTKMK